VQRIDAVVASLKAQAYIVRLAYTTTLANTATQESDLNVQARMRALQSALRDAWKAHGRTDALRTEEEIVRPAQPAHIEAKP
jgi:hypothetical protein